MAEDKEDKSLQKTTSSLKTKMTRKGIYKPEKIISEVKVDETDWNKNQRVDVVGSQVKKTETAEDSPVKTIATASGVTGNKAQTYDASTTNKDVVDATKKFKSAQGTVSEEGQVVAATAKPSESATVQGQLASLMEQFKDGETPAWAAGAKRKADAVMAQRGLGASSMAASAVTQSLMESATEIAIQDASIYAGFEMKNLDNRQQARVLNAQAFLQMDLENLNNEQQMAVLKSQSIIQSLFTDAAAENASKQFNATSKNQTNQFFSQLRSQVRQFNAAQTNAVRMQNKQEANVISMFNAQAKNARNQFNASNRLIIDQSNANWRRQIATQDNAAINEANRQNALAATEMTMAAYNNLWQEARDLMAFAFTASENVAERANRVVLQKLANEGGVDVVKARDGDSTKNLLGMAAGRFVGNLVDSAADSLIGALF